MSTFPHHPSPPSLFLSPSFSSIFTVYRGPALLPLPAMARRPHRGVDLLLSPCTIPTVHLLRSTPLRVEPPIQPVAHHARLCFYTQVSHITAETVLCSSRGVGEGGGRGGAGVDTNTWFSQTRTFPSRHRPRRCKTWRHGRALLMRQLLVTMQESGFRSRESRVE